MKRKEKWAIIQQKRGCEESEMTPGPKEGPPQGGSPTQDLVKPGWPLIHLRPSDLMTWLGLKIKRVGVHDNGQGTSTRLRTDKSRGDDKCPTVETLVTTTSAQEPTLKHLKGADPLQMRYLLSLFTKWANKLCNLYLSLRANLPEKMVVALAEDYKSSFRFIKKNLPTIGSTLIRNEKVKLHKT